MEQLNKNQKKAVLKKAGPTLVLAGAGSGKTKTLTERIINLIEQREVLPQNILALTFTNKAAAEMKKRIQEKILENPKLNFPVLENGFFPHVSTFHSLGVFILKDNYKSLGISKFFSIYNKEDSKKTLKEAMKNMEIDIKEFEPKKFLSLISKNKGAGISFEDFLKNFSEEKNFYNQTFIKAWGEYEKLKKEDKSYDFDDLLLESLKILEIPERREHYLKKWTHIHIDEYQDTNEVQQKMLEALTNPEKKNIFAVGDPDQLIYSWRGSKIENILNFSKKFQETETIFLEENYRSSGNIVEASNFVIEKNENRFPKKLVSQKEIGEKISLYTAFSEKDEALFVVEKIKDFLKNKINLNEISVLYRANFQSRVLEEAFLKAGISYQVLGTKFFERAEVKDIISYLKSALNRDSKADLKRVYTNPKRGIGKTSILRIFNSEIEKLSPKIKDQWQKTEDFLDEIKKHTEKNKISETINFIIEGSGIEKSFREKKDEDSLERLANCYEISSFASKYDEFSPEEGLEKFLEEVSLMSDVDSKKENKQNPAVKLMTIHAAKGLEFEYIFLVGAEEALFSAQTELSKKEEKEKNEEERRLFYVAMTRAKEKLFISWAQFRNMYGSLETNFISSFVLDIPEKFLEKQDDGKNLSGGYLEEEIYID